MKHFTKCILRFVAGTATALAMVLANTFSVNGAYAANNNAMGFSMSPLKENIILNPGDSYDNSFTIFNPATNSKVFPYELSISPFYVDENYTNVFTAEGDYSEIAEWITIKSPLTGTIAPNESVEIDFSINVPENAPAGGQYAAIIVSSSVATNEGENSSAIIERTAIAHTIFAEITGTTIRTGDITDINVPAFLLSGEISGESTIKNTGNVHGKATYTLQVSSLSGEEIYSNADSPSTHDILPDRTYYNKTSWANTPAIGIYNVVYTVTFNGVTKEASKIVIVCPIWLLVIVAGIIVAIIIGIAVIIRKRRA